MPLHLSVHYNGWTQGAPNPENFKTQRGLHAKFERAYVRANISAAEIEAKVQAPMPTNEPIEERLKTFLSATYNEILPTDYIAGRMASSVAQMRDLIALAWTEAYAQPVGWPETTAKKVEAGEDPTGAL